MIVVLSLAVMQTISLKLPTRIAGYTSGEAFFEGMPTRYWVDELAFNKVAAAARLQAGNERLPVLTAIAADTSLESEVRVVAIRLLAGIRRFPR